VTAPQIRNPKLTASEILAMQGRLTQPQSLADDLLNLELMGVYPDDSDPFSQSLISAAYDKWGRSRLRLAQAEEPPDFASRTRTQVRRARELIHEDFAQCVQLPWPSLAEVIGHGLLPYQLWTIAAASGHGKTTFAMNLVKAWVEMGKRVYVVPLEQPTDVMRVYLAALTLNFPTRLALANRWREMLNPTAQDAVDAELVRQEDESELLHFSDVDFLTVSGLPAVLKEAQAFGADVILIDHIHHVRVEGHNSAAEFVRLCQTLGDFTKNQRTPIVSMAQLNRGQGPRDRLKPYLPPDVDSIQMGKVLEQVSSVVMGLFRPLVSWVDKAIRARIRLGAPVKPYLKPNTMAVDVLKSRISGDCGEIVDLVYDRGHISDRELEQ
jgi:KaiC/GvpD/RAD55 family RecA-like ATPase